MATKRVLMNFSRGASLLRIVGELQFDGLVTEFCQSVSREEKVFEAINRGKFSLNCSRFGLDFSCVIVQENADKNDRLKFLRIFMLQSIFPPPDLAFDKNQPKCFDLTARLNYCLGN